MENNTTSSPDTAKHRRWVRLLWRAFGSMGILAILLFAWLSFQLPSFEELENPKFRIASTVYAADGSILGTYYDENRLPVEFSDLPTSLVEALIATEDVRYYAHSGVDSWALWRVALKTIALRKESSGGGSTISQQLAKLLVGRTDTRGMWLPNKVWTQATTKFKEWLTAIRLERCYTKEEIIAMYFNEFDFLFGACGIRSASKTYFDKEPKDLNIEECAMLVGMLKNPSMFNPKNFPERATARRETVLKQMLVNDYLHSDPQKAVQMYDSLRALPLKLTFKRQDHNEGLAPHFREHLRMKVKEWLKDKKKPDGSTYDVYRDGLKIYTTIDPKMQAHAEAAVREHLTAHQKLLFEHWKGMDPWLEKNNKSEVPEEARQGSLKRLCWESDRWQLSREKYMPLVTQKELREIDIDRMLTIERLEAEKVGTGKAQLEKWRETKFIDSKHYDQYTKIMASGEWEKVKKEYESMDRFFKTPTQTKVFSYNETGELDTLISPYDSIRYHRMILQTGMVVLDPHTGQVKAWVGGTGFQYFKLDHVSPDHVRRQVGSIIKPLLYGLSFDYRGFGPCYLVPDVKQTIHRGEGRFGLIADWSPDNADGGYSGQTVTLKEALKHSLNSVSAFLMKDFKSTAPFREFLSKVGIDTSLVPPQPSICLGTPDLSVLEMAGAYTIFPNQGVYEEPIYVTRIEDKNGNVIYDGEESQQIRQAINAEAAYAMTYMLRGVIEGQGGFDGIRSKVGGKTGTTQEQSDGWYMGIAPNLVSATWVGCDDRFLRFRSLANGQGARMARPIFQKFMRRIESDPSVGYNVSADFVKPDPFNIELNCSAYALPSDMKFFGGEEYDPEDESEYGSKWDEAGDTAKRKPPTYH